MGLVDAQIIEFIHTVIMRAIQITPALDPYGRAAYRDFHAQFLLRTTYIKSVHLLLMSIIATNLTKY